MSSSTHSSLFLVLVFLLFTSQLTEAQSSGYLNEKVSGEDNVEGTQLIIAKLRMLLGLHTSSSARAPAEPAAESPFPLPPLNQAPPPLQMHVPIVHGTEDHVSESTKKKHSHMIVAISVSVLATLAISGVITLLVLAYGQHQRRVNAGQCNSSNKVSFDPEIEKHYLDTLAAFLEIDSDHKLPSESKSVVSILSSSPSQNEEVDASHHAKSLSSDDNESFHSVCCSHCSYESTSTVFEPSLDGSPENIHLSPLTITSKCRLSTFFIASAMKSTSSSSNEMYIEPSHSSQCPKLEVAPASIWSSSKGSESSNLATSSYQEEPSAPASADNMGSAMPLQALQSIISPPPGGSIPRPPPPPPPPLFRKNSCFQKPPPPSQLPQIPPTDKDGNPLPKLRPLHWDKVRAAPDRSMVWDKIRSSSFELDEKTIGSLFGYNMQCSARNEESKMKNSSPGKQLLEHKRLQNFTILLKALNATAEQVCNSLMLGSGLGTQQLEALAKMVPTKEEEEKLYRYEGDIGELGSTEKFLKVILCIPSAFSRIEVMLYRETFDDEVIHLKKSFEMLEEACKELRSSRLFLRLLEAVLKTGNRMNVGTTRGGARAFKLDALLKLADVKGTDGKTTLLHFVVQEMIKSESFSAYEKKNDKALTKNKIAKEREEYSNARGLQLVSSLSSELCNVKKTASMDLDVLASSVSNLSKGMSKLKELVKEEVLSSNERDGGFVNSMRSFQKQGEGVIRELKDSEDRVLRHVGEITEYYHGNVSKDEANPLRIFVIVSDFLAMLDRVCKELKSSKTTQTLNLIVLPPRCS